MFESMVTFSGQWLLTTAHVYRASRDWLSLCYAIARARNRGKFTACHCLKIMAWLPPVSPATAQRLDSWTFPLPPYDSFGHTEIARSGRRAAPIFPHDATLVRARPAGTIPRAGMLMKENADTSGSRPPLPRRLPFRRDVGPDHLRRVDDAVELRLGDKAKLQGGLFQRQVVVGGVMRDLRRLVVADHRRQGGDQHQRLLHVLLDLLEVRPRSFHQE